VETFLDDGYMDMYKVMKVLYDVDYDGTITLDHTPKLTGDPQLQASTAYAIGYMRALCERAEAELKI
jgi:mannonate dehydratase